MPVIIKLPSGGITKCKQISNLQAKVGSAVNIKLTWTNPSDPKFKGLEIFYKEGSEPTKYGDGTKCYDSNDGVVASSKEISGLTNGTTYYFRAFAYTYKNATRVYTELKDGAIASAIPKREKGKITITSSQTWTVPQGVESIDVFLVGAGGGAYGDNGECGGGGGGYTKTFKNISVTPNSQHSVIIGSGVIGGEGGATKFDNYTANGGKTKATQFRDIGGDGGSAGGASGIPRGMDGAANGGNCQSDYTAYGQGSTTREFEKSNGTLYAGGGGGAGYVLFGGGAVTSGAGGAGGGGRGGTRNLDESGLKGLDGSQGTGGGGGGLAITHNRAYHTKGGSGVCIIRWGY